MEHLEKNGLVLQSLLIPLFNRVQAITGWLSHEEADGLICSTIKVGVSLGQSFNVVEIGSYHGKSTVLIGSVLKMFFGGAKIYAVDPHEGNVTAQGLGISATSPTLEHFAAHILSSGLIDIVIPIKDFSFNVQWVLPIGLLFIDGLHDYENVSRDFFHYEPYVVENGLIAFHDYGTGFPGVTRFVDETLATGRFRPFLHSGSLFVVCKSAGR